MTLSVSLKGCHRKLLDVALKGERLGIKERISTACS